MPANRILKQSHHTEINTTADKDTMQINTPLSEHTSIKSKPISDCIKRSFKQLAPFWPLKNLIAVNPLQGLEDLPIEEAFKHGAAYFQQSDLPQPMEAINRESIKWLQVYCDEGQARIAMPLRENGLYVAWRQLVVYDKRLHHNNKQTQHWLQTLPIHADQAIEECLIRLGITNSEREHFLTLMLTTLPGWAAYIKYRTEWPGLDAVHPYPITQTDYLALRLVITCLLWPKAKVLLVWHSKCLESTQLIESPLKQMRTHERNYHIPLLKKLAVKQVKTHNTPKVQLVFCIDVRSEPFRRALEAVGDYETLGFAGFFGLPVQITDVVSGESYVSCPVLLSPKHQIKESPAGSQNELMHEQQRYNIMIGCKRLYQSVKYTFSTPFGLVESLGIFSGIWMALRSLFPQFASNLHTSLGQIFGKSITLEPCLDNITLDEQCAYAESALKMMGLTRHFATLVVFCGHGSTTQNNAYATMLDCGACGGRRGAGNARIIAAILNQKQVRTYLALKNIFIPEQTYFMAAEHNTTTDEMTLYGDISQPVTRQLKQDLEKARLANGAIRLKKMRENRTDVNAAICARAQDWAQVRPEWGLARNAAFIVAPRGLTQALDLEGRVFLHSYDWQEDINGVLLTTILTAPMLVAQWINSQYLFSTLDNIAFGGGNKITQNITGKISVMQGNASDLMTGLPFQSVYLSDTETYHDLMRLMTIVFAPRAMIDPIISAQPVLQKLLGNGWVKMACIEPEDRKIYRLQRDLTWRNIDSIPSHS